MIAGLEDISAGELYIDNILSNNVDASKRNIAMVFQSYALYPHMTSYGNMAYGLKLRKVLKPVLVVDKEAIKELKENRKNTANAEEIKQIDAKIAELKANPSKEVMMYSISGSPWANDNTSACMQTNCFDVQSSPWNYYLIRLI